MVNIYYTLRNAVSSNIVYGYGGNDAIDNSDDDASIYGGDGNDTIIILNGGSVNGGAVADRISLLSNSSYARTVKGGTDNDTIYGDSLGSAVVYQYARGDGNDVIYGHKSTDTIAIMSGAYRKSTVGSNLVLNITSGANSTVSTGRITVNGGASRSINITGTQVTVGGGRSTTPSATVSQQEVIKKFMGSLDTTSYSGISAVNQAVSVASGGYFKTAQAVIDAMVSDRNRAGNGNNFLLNYCGINLDNADTGAITGSDAGGSTDKTATSIVPESGSLINFTGNSFTTKGLTVRLVNWDASDNYTLTTVSSLNSVQKQIWQSFYTWWAGNGLDLIAESYGNNYSFTSSSSATAKTLYFGFVDDEDDALAWTLNGTRYGYLGMAVNMDSYSNLSSTNVNGYDPISDQTYLDRTLAHELTHAVMMANIKDFYYLPKYIKEGMAELTHGIDDERYTSIKNLVANTTRMRQALVSSASSVTVSGVSSPSYVGGYTFLRYLAKQGSAHYGQTASANVAEDKNVSINGAVLTVTQNYQKNAIDLTAYDSSVKKVNASKLKDGVTIIGNEFANSIKGGAGNDSIHGNSGNDTLLGGAGDDYIYGDGGNNLLKGEAGNDTLFGAGNDTFTGGAGNDLFVYNAEATGNGVITDYSAGDSIKISGGKINNTIYKGRDVIFELGASTLTVKNGKGKTIDISATDWINEDDDNFISDDAQISSITQENYSVTNVETVNYSALVQNNRTLLTFAKK